MRQFQKYVNPIIFLLILLLSFNTNYNPFHPVYFEPSINVSKNSDPLYEDIKIIAESDQYIENPQDAYIDRVWKKTPGRNGQVIDIDKSYKRMKAAGKFNEALLIYKEVPPEISLEDLPPAPIYRGHPEKEMNTLLINVSWGGEHIPSILETLKNKKVKANFFIEGKWARENADLVKMIKEQGHLIGNHAYNHPDMARISSDEILKQISQTNEILKAITGEIPKYFAPPSGSFNDEVVRIASELGMETILWTTDTIDWKNPSISVMINRVNTNIHPGATILMHPTQVIEEGLDDIIELIEDKNYRIGTLDRLLDENR